MFTRTEQYLEIGGISIFGKKRIEKKIVGSCTSGIPQKRTTLSWSGSDIAQALKGVHIQLVHLPTGKLEMDCIVTSKTNSTHVLIVGSPRRTSAIPYGRYLSNRIIIENTAI